VRLNVSSAVAGLTPTGGDLEADLDDLVDGLLSALEQSFAPVVENAVAGVVGGPLRDLANAATSRLLRRWRDGCPPPPPPPPAPPPAPPPPPDAVDWRSTPLQLAGKVMEEVGAPLVNRLVDQLPSVANGTVALPPLETTLGPLAVSVGSARLGGLDSLSTLVPLAPQPDDPYNLASAVALRGLHLSLEANLSLAQNQTNAFVAPPPRPLRLRLNLSLASLALSAASRLVLRPAAIAALPVRLLNSTACLSRAVSFVDLHALVANATLASVALAANDWRPGPPPAEPTTFDEPMSLSLPPPLAAALAAAASRQLAHWLEAMHGRSCAAAAPPPPPHLLDFRTNAMVARLHNLSVHAPVDKAVDELSAVLGKLAPQLFPANGTLRLPWPMARTIRDAKVCAERTLQPAAWQMNGPFATHAFPAPCGAARRHRAQPLARAALRPRRRRRALALRAAAVRPVAAQPHDRPGRHGAARAPMHPHPHARRRPARVQPLALPRQRHAPPRHPHPDRRLGARRAQPRRARPAARLRRAAARERLARRWLLARHRAAAARRPRRRRHPPRPGRGRVGPPA
jgi:hypothetical protein